MKPHIRYSPVSLLFVLPLQAQEEPTLAIQPHPAVTVSGEAGSTYVIESKNGVDDHFYHGIRTTPTKLLLNAK